MNIKRITAAAIIALAFVGCASMSPEEEAAAAQRVRVVTDAGAVRDCDVIRAVTDDEIQRVQVKAARLGGDVALVISQAQRGGRLYTTALVYHCGGGGCSGRTCHRSKTSNKQRAGLTRAAGARISPPYRRRPFLPEGFPMRIRIATAVLAVLVALTGPMVARAQDNEIRLGAFMPVSGISADVGAQIKAGIEVAAERMPTITLGGKPTRVRVIWYDTEGKGD